MTFNPYDVQQQRRDAIAEQHAEDLDRATYTSRTLHQVQIVRSDDPVYVFAELFCPSCDETIGELAHGENLDEIAYTAHLHVIREHR